ncbi:hypothetical protein N0V90_011208 [Kalmusia sp. IMI 367209]|nr:hypothetical protein N0V90_011208 [Kalmusia sp. IMI 367209]
MTSLIIDETAIPALSGKVALITGGASGIGFAAAKLLATKDATVHILDRHPPSATASFPPVHSPLSERIIFHQCDVTHWKTLRGIFAKVGHVDYVFANAGISENENFLADTLEEEMKSNTSITRDEVLNQLAEPAYPLVDVNLKSVLNVIKLAHHSFKRDTTRGSIVITSSSTAYSPEQSLPVYSALKLALVGLIRSLRHNLAQDDITINAVVPACTETALVGDDFLGPIKEMGLPVSSARHVGAALVYSAVATQTRKVDIYGKEPLENLYKAGRWNGRVILTLGDMYTELEEKLADLRPQWFGEENLRLQNQQQAVTDFRDFGVSGRAW